MAATACHVYMRSFKCKPSTLLRTYMYVNMIVVVVTKWIGLLYSRSKAKVSVLYFIAIQYLLSS